MEDIGKIGVIAEDIFGVPRSGAESSAETDHFDPPLFE
jgi:hypothetical protein